MNKVTLRPAIAMIELIFAMVIIAIALMSAPMLISQATKSGFVAIQQEGINEAATKVNMIMGYQWDEENTDESFLPSILHVSAVGDNNLSEYNITGRRRGTPLVSQRTFIRSDGQEFFASTAIGFEINDLNIEDDMDDFNDDHVLEPRDMGQYNYVETTTIDINTLITYFLDAPGGGSYNDPGGDGKLTFSPDFSTSVALPNSTNIKKIVTTLTSSSIANELNKTIILNAFTCNIGSYKLESRAF